MLNAKILETIQHGDAIPAMPQIVTRLLEITSDENYKQADVIDLLATDPSIAGCILKLANSALFGVTRQISSLNQAVTLLGVKRIRTLVLGRSMIDRFDTNGDQVIDPSYFWRRSLATGVLAARFADQAAPQRREESFIGGLLSDIGVIVLARALPNQYKPVAKGYAPCHSDHLVAQEIETVGVSHAAVSALILERWMLPEEMVTAVRLHHDRPGGAEVLFQLDHGGAAEVARLLCEMPDKNTIGSTCEAAMKVVGLNLDVLQHILKDIESDISGLAEVLRIDIIPSRVYSIIAGSIAEQLVETVP